MSDPSFADAMLILFGLVMLIAVTLGWIGYCIACWRDRKFIKRKGSKWNK